MIDSYNKIFKTVNNVLVVLAHPDDAEVVCGGLISRLTADNKHVRLIVTTNGGKGMQNKKNINEDDFGKMRTLEQLNAGKILGINENNNFNLNLPDGEVETSIVNIEKVVFHIRDFKPDIIITHNPQDYIIKFDPKVHWVNHRDHRNTAQITLDAMYPYSRDRGFFPNHFKKGLEPHKVTKVLLADSYSNELVSYFDISGFTETKVKALMHHPSAINPAHANDYLEENLIGGRYYESLLYTEIY